jgi:hypothetical protein
MKSPRKSSARKQSKKRKQKLRVPRLPKRSKLESSVGLREKLPPKEDAPLLRVADSAPEAVPLQQAKVRANNELRIKRDGAPKEGKQPTTDDSDSDEPALPKEFQSSRRAQWNRWRRLATNKEFVWKTSKLKYQMAAFVNTNRDELRRLFDSVFFITLPNLRTSLQRIDSVSDEKLNALLKRYARYVLRYDVIFVFKATAPYFRTQSIGFWGNRFHVELRNGQLEPVGGAPTWDGQTPLSDGFESPEVNVPAALRSLVENEVENRAEDEPLVRNEPKAETLIEGRPKGNGKNTNKYPMAKYARIDDEDDFSVVNQIMNFLYSPDQVAVIEYRSPLFRRQLFMIGENVSLNQVWGQLKKVVTEWQRETGRSDQRGKPPDIRRLSSLLNTIVRGDLDAGATAARFLKWDKLLPDIEMENQKTIANQSTIKTRPAESGVTPKSPQDKAMSSMVSYISQLKAQLQE